MLLDKNMSSSNLELDQELESVFIMCHPLIQISCVQMQETVKLQVLISALPTITLMAAKFASLAPILMLTAWNAVISFVILVLLVIIFPETN